MKKLIILVCFTFLCSTNSFAYKILKEEMICHAKYGCGVETIPTQTSKSKKNMATAFVIIQKKAGKVNELVKVDADTTVYLINYTGGEEVYTVTTDLGVGADQNDHYVETISLSPQEVYNVSKNIYMNVREPSAGEYATSINEVINGMPVYDYDSANMGSHLTITN
jgi:hypothetical protein